MNRREAKDILGGYRLLLHEETDLRHAFDLAIEALEREIKYGQMVVDFTKGETMKSDEWKYDTTCVEEALAPKEMTLEEWQELDREIRGAAESAMTTDCISRQAAIDACIDLLENLPPVNQKQITGKLETAETATSEGEESTMNQPKSKLDCISRQDAIEALMAHFIPQTYTGEQVEQAEKLAQKIMNKVPPVTPTEKTGEWIPCTKEGLALTELMRREGKKWYGYRCTNCNFIYKGNALTESRYCQGCGAKMKGGTEND